MDVPHATPPEQPIVPHDGRFSERLRPIEAYAPGPSDRQPIAILGMPDDTGVRLNNGRPGAREGPSAIRRALSRMGVADPAGFDWPQVFDAGDVLPAGDDLDETHRRISEAAEALVRAGFFPIGLGGGHDLTFAFVRGVMHGLPEAERPLSGHYLDPHLDVRETPGSGMPFRRLLEDCGVRTLHIYGFDPVANTREHHDWFTSHGGVVDRGHARLPSEPFFVSLDLDVLDASAAPGVSAANAAGLQPSALVPWLREAAGNANIRCFDVMELCPAHDDADRTARVAARLLLAFLQGRSERRTKGLA
ncbi:MAG: formimidoylglutamase [Planctomycetota bacterium]